MVTLVAWFTLILHPNCIRPPVSLLFPPPFLISEWGKRRKQQGNWWSYTITFYVSLSWLPFGGALLAMYGDEQNCCCPCLVTAQYLFLDCKILRGPHPTAWNQEGLCLHTRASLMLTGVCLPSALSSIDNAFYLTNNKPSTHKHLQHTTTFHLKTMHLSSTCYKPWERHHNILTPSLHLYVP